MDINLIIMQLVQRRLKISFRACKIHSHSFAHFCRCLLTQHKPTVSCEDLAVLSHPPGSETKKRTPLDEKDDNRQDQNSCRWVSLHTPKKQKDSNVTDSRTPSFGFPGHSRSWAETTVPTRIPSRWLSKRSTSWAWTSTGCRARNWATWWKSFTSWSPPCTAQTLTRLRSTLRSWSRPRCARWSNTWSPVCTRGSARCQSRCRAGRASSTSLAEVCLFPGSSHLRVSSSEKRVFRWFPLKSTSSIITDCTSKGSYFREFCQRFQNFFFYVFLYLFFTGTIKSVLYSTQRLCLCVFINCNIRSRFFLSDAINSERGQMAHCCDWGTFHYGLVPANILSLSISFFYHAV